jgi:hypothetical protein
MITRRQRDDMISLPIDDCRLPVRLLGNSFHISREPVRQIRHSSGFHFCDSVKVGPLSIDAIRDRMAFSQMEINQREDRPRNFPNMSIMALFCLLSAMAAET